MAKASPVPILCMALLGSLACAPTGLSVRPDTNVTSRTTITGSVNQSAVEGSINATFNTGRGGSSTCRLPVLPQTFTPATFGTHT